MISKFIITLKTSDIKNINAYSFDKNNIKYELFYGVNSKFNEHLDYKKLIHPLSLLFTPKSILGITLSHILLAKKIVKDNIKYALILEDDAYPFDYNSLEDNINKVIDNFNKIDKNWDMINLHTDGIFQDDTKNINLYSGSSAAYLISINGAKKIANSYAYHNFDLQTTIDPQINKYKNSKNLFWTNEKYSINRNNSKNILKDAISYILSLFISFRGEKNWHILLSFYLIRIPWVECELDGFILLIFSLITISYFILQKIL